jgi:hypothetical protein
MMAKLNLGNNMLVNDYPDMAQYLEMPFKISLVYKISTDKSAYIGCLYPLNKKSNQLYHRYNQLYFVGHLNRMHWKNY